MAFVQLILFNLLKKGYIRSIGLFARLKTFVRVQGVRPRAASKTQRFKELVSWLLTYFIGCQYEELQSLLSPGGSERPMPAKTRSRPPSRQHPTASALPKPERSTRNPAACC